APPVPLALPPLPDALPLAWPPLPLALPLLPPLPVAVFMHLPIDASVDEQASLLAHPLPPEPRHPSMHWLVVASQTRPESTAPQSASVLQPHASIGRQAEPLPVEAQFVVSVFVHSTHVFVPATSQTNGAGQSPAETHCTQPCGSVVVSHLRS